MTHPQRSALDCLRKSQLDWAKAREIPHDVPRTNRGNYVKGLDRLPLLIDHLKNPVLLEIGSETGGSAWFFCEKLPDVTVICCDLWNVRGLGKGFFSGEKKSEEADRALSITKRLGMWSVFAHQVRAFHDRIIPLQGDRLRSIRLTAEAGVKPDLVYVDCMHTFPEVLEDLELCHALFPNAILAGDDYWSPTWGVLRSVEAFAEKHGVRYYLYGSQFVFDMNLVSIPESVRYPELEARLAERNVSPGPNAVVRKAP